METLHDCLSLPRALVDPVPPSGGSLEIGNHNHANDVANAKFKFVPPSGGSLEIGNSYSVWKTVERGAGSYVPPSGGSLEIGNSRWVSRFAVHWGTV